MPDLNTPSDKHGANIYLKGKKQACLELLAKICEQDMKTGSQISELIVDEIEYLDEQLES